jgi:hypothetical protein
MKRAEVLKLIVEQLELPAKDKRAQANTMLGALEKAGIIRLTNELKGFKRSWSAE